MVSLVPRPVGFLPHKSRGCLQLLKVRKPLLRVRSREADEPEVPMTEDIISRLKMAEEEAAKLRKELAASQAAQPKDTVNLNAESVGGEEPRESQFSWSVQRKNWLNETDVEFLIGEGPTEGGVQGLTEEGEATVKKRLALGVTISVLAGALALIPSDFFRSRPSDPLSYYLVPLLRSKELLGECDALVNNGDWDQVLVALERINKSPNFVRRNLEGAAGYISTSEKRAKGSELIQDFMEHLEQVDFSKYFKDIGEPGRIGAGNNIAYIEFSAKALKATQSSLSDFLALLPREEIIAAEESIMVLNG